MTGTFAGDENELRSLLAEGIHTAFRKGTDCDQAMPIHRLISAMPDGEWGAVVDFVLVGLGMTWAGSL